MNYNTYKKRLTKNEMNVNLKELEHMKEDLWKIRKNIAKNVKTVPWTKENLEEVLKKLNINKAKDPHGLANVLFKDYIAGENLKDSLLILCNKIKQHQEIPDFLQIVNVTSIFKQKCDKSNLDNYRAFLY